jgi:hypothetical protein
MWKYSKYKDSSTGAPKDHIVKQSAAVQQKLVKSKSKSDNSNSNVPKFSLEAFLESYLNNEGFEKNFFCWNQNIKISIKIKKEK